jgi:hypothetical protein
MTKLEKLNALIKSTNPPMSRSDACMLLGYDPKDPELVDSADIPDFLKDLFKV